LTVIPTGLLVFDFSDINLLNICFQPRYNLIEIKRGIDKLLKKLNRIYFKRDVLKYTLPEEITRNRIKAPIQNFNNIRISDFFVFGQEKILEMKYIKIIKQIGQKHPMI